jgi:hypothetical protein
VVNFEIGSAMKSLYCSFSLSAYETADDWQLAFMPFRVQKTNQQRSGERKGSPITLVPRCETSHAFQK